MNKRGNKTYKAKHYYEFLAIGDIGSREWLKTDKKENVKAMRKAMVRRWRRGLKQSLIIDLKLIESE